MYNILQSCFVINIIILVNSYTAIMVIYHTSSYDFVQLPSTGGCRSGCRHNMIALMHLSQTWNGGEIESGQINNIIIMFFPVALVYISRDFLSRKRKSQDLGLAEHHTRDMSVWVQSPLKSWDFLFPERKSWDLYTSATGMNYWWVRPASSWEPQWQHCHCKGCLQEEVTFLIIIMPHSH